MSAGSRKIALVLVSMGEPSIDGWRYFCRTLKQTRCHCTGLVQLPVVRHCCSELSGLSALLVGCKQSKTGWWQRPGSEAIRRWFRFTVRMIDCS